MKKLILLALTFVALQAQAQSNTIYSIKYGVVPPFEVAEKSYADDPEAEAAVIYETGDYRFVQYETATQKGFHLKMTIATKIKIYNEAGLDYARIEIPYYSPSHDSENVTIEGATFNLQGETVVSTPLGKAHIFTEKGPGEWMVKKVAFPDVRAGSVIELKYTIVTPYFFNMRQWDFQKKIPVWHSKLEYSAIPFYEYAFVARGLSKFDERDEEVLTLEQHFSRYKYKEMKHSFVLNKVPAFRDEEFLYNTEDYMANINFQLASYFSFSSRQMTDVMTTWPKMCQDLLKDNNFGKFMDAAEKEGKNIIPGLNLAGKTEQEKFQTVTRYVKSMYTWDKNLGKFSNKKLSELLKEKTGNSAALNLMLTGLLKAAGLDANPVILSTTPNGWIYKDYPFTQLINNVIPMVRIDGEDYFADATFPLTRHDEVAWWCVSVEGLIVDKKTPEWVVITDSETPSENNLMLASISPDGSTMSVNMTQTLNGNSAYRQRAAYNGDMENLKDQFKGKEGMTVNEISVVNFQETEKPFIIQMQYDMTIGQPGSNVDRIYLNPLLYVSPAANPFKQANRTHPIDLIHQTLDNYHFELVIPEGYSIEYLPKTHAVRNDIMTVIYQPSVKENKIVLKAGYAMRNFYYAEEYRELKSMYDDMVRAFTEVIILKKD